ncbi:MAG: hypothetical protein ACI97A_002912 [Planctomycetota bacterium]|jgi:hypothetical protein
MCRLTSKWNPNPNALFQVYGSPIVASVGFTFIGFGIFDLGTAPFFNDVFILLNGFQSGFPLDSLDAGGEAHLSFYLNPDVPAGGILNIQALIQNPQPFTNGVWSTLSAAHGLLIQ